MTYTENYTKQTWADLPEQTTPLSAERLTHIEEGIKTNDTRIVAISEKVDENTEKLSGIENNAQENVVDVIKVNGTALVPENKTVDIDISETPIATAQTPGKVKPDGETVTIDADGTIHAAGGGGGGDSDSVWYPTVTDGVVSWAKSTSQTAPTPTNIQGPQGPPGADGSPGADGAPGEDGVSPTVAMSKTGKVTTLTITDVTGEHTEIINDGEDGVDGVSHHADTTHTSIAVADVVANDDTYASVYPYKVDLAITGITADYQASITYVPGADLEAVGIHTNCLDGIVRVYFKSVPAAAIAIDSITYWEVV